MRRNSGINPHIAWCWAVQRNLAWGHVSETNVFARRSGTTTLVSMPFTVKEMHVTQNEGLEEKNCHACFRVLKRLGQNPSTVWL